MPKTGWCYDARCLLHKTGPGHPERPERLRAITRAMDDLGLMRRLTPLAFGPAERRWLEANHAPAYIDRVEQACRSGQTHIDTLDCPISPESYEAATLAVGAALAACDGVMTGEVANACCTIRPPGHHAEHDLAMGFCLFNNIAIAARYLQQRWGLQRILILDWDVHHGNGTQHAFESDPSVFFCSLHEDPSRRYPGTGYETERGRGAGTGFTLNIPMESGASDADYRRAFEQTFLPAARTFKPDFVLISAGFDAHADDPLAAINLSDEAFDDMTRAALDLAHECCGGRLVSLLEGGYDLDALGRCVAKHIRLLLEHHPAEAHA